jgi:hypothetical protein
VSAFSALSTTSPAKIALVGVLIGLTYYALGDKGEGVTAQIATIQTEIQTNTSSLEKLKQVFQDFEKYKKDLAGKTESLVEAKQLLASPLVAADLMTLISNNIHKNTGKVKLIQPQTPLINEAGLEELVIEVDFTAGFVEVLSFLSEMTRQKLVFITRNIKLIPAAAADGGRLNFQGDLIFYRMPPELASKPAIGGVPNNAAPDGLNAPASLPAGGQ